MDAFHLDDSVLFAFEQDYKSKSDKVHPNRFALPFLFFRHQDKTAPIKSF
jgi:hypothetical protein